MNFTKGITPFILGISVAALAVVVGCGGGGGSSSTGTSTSSTSTSSTSTSSTSTGGTYGISSAEHVAASGDSYTYTISSVSQVTGGTSTESGTGLRTESIISNTLNGAATLSHQISDIYRLTSANVSFFDGYFFTQDSAADVLFAGDAKGTSNSDRTASSPIQFFPGTWTISIGENGTTTMTPSGSTNYSLVNQGQATITTSLGTFTCWKVQITKTVDTVTRTGTYYYDPKIGNYVSGVETITDTAANTVTTLQLTLSVTNVPLG